MTETTRFGDVAVEPGNDYVFTAELCRPPHNFFDIALIDNLADALDALDTDPACRVVILRAQGKNFCAGAQLDSKAGEKSEIVRRNDDGSERHLYDAALRLVETTKPIVAAIHGAAIGGGLGVAMMADFRIASPDARFAANFARLGFHQGFGLTVTLPDAIGRQRAMELFYTGRRVAADEALAMGLIDRLSPQGSLVEAAREFAREIAAAAPLAVRSIRQTLRGDLPERIRAATAREKVEQERLWQTEDFAEGVAATAERRDPVFKEK